MIKVLLIVSDPTTRDTIQVGLRNFPGFEVEHAEDRWAVDMAREERYDLILASTRLSGEKSGLDIVRRIREFDSTSEIILITKGHSAKAVGREKTALNLFGHLEVPIDDQAFFKTLRRAKDLIDRKRRQAEEPEMEDHASGDSR